MIHSVNNKESTRLLKERENALYNAATRLNLLQHPWIKPLVVFGACGLDFSTLLPTMDSILTQNYLLSIIVTAGIAFCINIIPVFLGQTIRSGQFNSKERKWLSIMLCSLFAVMFLITFLLRISTGHEVLGAADTIDLGLGMETATEESPLTMGQILMLTLLGFEPLITSGISFWLAYIENPDAKIRHIQTLYKIDLQDAIDTQTVMISELQADIDFDLVGNDSGLFDALNATMDAQAEEAKVRSRRSLAEKVATPEAVTYLLEEGYLTQQPERKESDEDSDYNGSIKFPA